MEGGERRSQSHSIEYNWLGSDLTQNTRERYIPILAVVVVMLNPHGHNHYIFIYYWITPVWRLL